MILGALFLPWTPPQVKEGFPFLVFQSSRGFFYSSRFFDFETPCASEKLHTVVQGVPIWNTLYTHWICTYIGSQGMGMIANYFRNVAKSRIPFFRQHLFFANYPIYLQYGKKVFWPRKSFSFYVSDNRFNGKQTRLRKKVAKKYFSVEDF